MKVSCHVESEMISLNFSYFVILQSVGLFLTLTGSFAHA